MLYISIYTFFRENNLVSPSQSGFKTGDLCINQLVSITHEIYKSLDNGYEVRAVSPDKSKDFGKMWHLSLLYKLKQNEITDSLLKILTDFLSNRKQRVVLTGKYST